MALSDYTMEQYNELKAERDALRDVLEKHPGWSGDVTFGTIWQWLADRERVLGMSAPLQALSNIREQQK